MPEKRKPAISIRPRVNSALERIHEERRREFPDLVHKWADDQEKTWADVMAQNAREENK